MIHKVYIVRCSYCHAPLRDPTGLDHRPRYFYQLDSIQEAMSEAGWGTLRGMQICRKCLQSTTISEL
jgi:hypothetical protein